MSEKGFGDWRSMESAPRDGARVLVAIRPTEQGPAEVDVVRWGSPNPGVDACWIAIDSDPEALVTYAEAELTWWMPMPMPLPRAPGSGRPVPPTPPPEPDEMEGSGI
jgi:hypothetical protein